MIDRCDRAQNRLSQSSERIPEGDQPVCDDVTVVTGGLRTLREIACFNAGVRVMLEQAATVANPIEGLPSFKVTRSGFAVEALRGLAEAGEQLLILTTTEEKQGETHT